MIEFGSSIPYDIRITGSGNKGFIVNVGCATCVFSNKTEVLEAIGDYLDNPEQVEKAYNESIKNRNPQPVPDSGIGATARGSNRLGPPTEECQQENCGPYQGRRR